MILSKTLDTTESALTGIAIVFHWCCMIGILWTLGWNQQLCSDNNKFIWIIILQYSSSMLLISLVQHPSASSKSQVNFNFEFAHTLIFTQKSYLRKES